VAVTIIGGIKIMGQLPKPSFGAIATLKGAATIQLALLVHFALFVIFGTLGAINIGTPVIILALLSMLTWAGACLVLALLGVCGFIRVLGLNREAKAKQLPSLGAWDREFDTHHKPRFTLSRMLAFAIVLGALWITSTRPSLAFRVAWPLTGLIIGAYMAIIVMDSIRCPNCGKRTLKQLRLMAPPKRYSYHRCGTCQSRRKRIGFGAWLDASSPEDDAIFFRKRDAGTWKGASTPDVDGATCGTLLSSKRQRNLSGMLKAVVKKPWRVRVCPVIVPSGEDTTCGKLLHNKRSRKPSYGCDPAEEGVQHQ
jgi:hypothetical protein